MPFPSQHAAATNPVATGKKIIIVGAGIAGLSFALSLRKQWPNGPKPPSLSIYERETREAILGREGYSLSIRGDALSGGIQVLQRLDLLERMLPFSPSTLSSKSGSFNLWSTGWESLLKFPVASSDDAGNSPTGMRIARAVLRRIMMDAVCEAESGPDPINWNKPCSKIETLPDGKVRVYLGDGTADDCDILIVADGASSKIRAQIRPEDKLQFTGVVCISGTSTFPDGQVPSPVDVDWGGVLGGGGTGLFVSPIDQNRALWSVSFYNENPRESLRYPMSDDQVESTLQEALERGQHFHQPFQTMVRSTDPSTLMVFNAMDKQPFAHKDCPEFGYSPVIFIGDANHAVSPFAGNGANMALLDGWGLAEQLIKGETMATAIERYDRESIPRSAATVKQSHWSISMLHATGVKLFLYRLMLRVVGIYLRWRK